MKSMRSISRVAFTAAALSLASAPEDSSAIERGRPVRGRVATLREAPSRPAAPAPRVALQLSALRVSEGVSMRAMLHAIARDAWPQLVACANNEGRGSRGVARVFVAAEGRAVRITELSGAPIARNPALRQCVRAAVERVHPPAREGTELTASFELYFDLPAL
ncbi:MAG: hypothetical protein JNK05_04795 [Myxococcales bacterium]|nr:hypothetical protein [Myxococcales bacterium]